MEAIREWGIYILYALAGSISFVMGENMIMLNALMLAMILDTVLGALKGIRFKRFSSHSLFRGIITKFLALSIVLLLQYTLNARFLSLSDDILAGVFGLLLVAEFVSIIQNYQMVRTGEQIEERDALSYIFNITLDRLRTHIESFKLLEKNKPLPPKM